MEGGSKQWDRCSNYVGGGFGQPIVVCAAMEINQNGTFNKTNSKISCLGNWNTLTSSTSYTLRTIETIYIYIHTTHNINASLNCHCVYSLYLRFSALKRAVFYSSGIVVNSELREIKLYKLHTTFYNIVADSLIVQLLQTNNNCLEVVFSTRLKFGYRRQLQSVVCAF